MPKKSYKHESVEGNEDELDVGEEGQMVKASTILKMAKLELIHDEEND